MLVFGNGSHPIGMAASLELGSKPLVDNHFGKLNPHDAGTESQDEQGNTVMNLILEPDETGFASIPDGLSEEPITLYAVFQ